MLKFVGDGRLMPYTNSGTTTIAAGTAVLVNDTVGIAVDSIAAGDTGSLALSGVFELTAEVGAWLQGQNLYFLAANVSFTTASTGNTLCAKAWAAKTTAAVTGLVRLLNQS